MFKLGAPPPTSTDATTNLKMKKPEQEPMMDRNNLKQTYINHTISIIYNKSLFSSRTKKTYVDNAVKTAFDIQTPPQQHPTSSKANTDFLDRQIFEKADLDYIPGLDYDLGPVYIPSKN